MKTFSGPKPMKSVSRVKAIGAPLVLALAFLTTSVATADRASAETSHPSATAAEVVYDLDMDGYIEREELDGVISGYFSHGLSKDDLVRVLRAYVHRTYIPPPRIDHMLDNAGWYKNPSGEELERMADNVRWSVDSMMRDHPRLARLVSQWTWAFEDDTSFDEAEVIWWTAHWLDESPPELLPAIRGLRWLSDGIESEFEHAMAYKIISYIELGYHETVSDILATDWLLNVVGEWEMQMVDVILRDYWPHPEGTEWRRYLLSAFESPITPDDVRVAKTMKSVEWEFPDESPVEILDRWLHDGVDKADVAYFMATTGTRNTRNLLRPYSTATTTVETEMGSTVTFWAVWHDRVTNWEAAFGYLERGLRTGEEIMGRPFPREDVYVYLERRPTDYGAAYFGDAISIGVYNNNVGANFVYHELGHYYFPGGVEPNWFVEGGAVLIEEYTETEGRRLTTFKVPDRCRHEEGIDDLAELEQFMRDGRDIRYCQYDMGVHFMGKLRNIMGRDAWGMAVESVYGLEFWHRLPGELKAAAQSSEEIYQVFMEFTPPDAIEEARAAWAQFHGGDFTRTATVEE